MAEVDLSQLAVDRTQTNNIGIRTRRHVLTRYVLPGLLIGGFVALMTWAVWDKVFPAKPVRVVPVLAMQSQSRAEGTELFNAAGWIEPRPTAIRVAALASGVVKNLPFETQRANSKLTFAERDYQRNLKAANSVSRREVDEAKTEMETTRAMLDELRDRESSLKSEARATAKRREALNVQLQLLADETQAKDETLAQVKAAEARVKQMSVAESEAELLLSRMTIRAPVDGRVYQLVGLPGARVGEGVMTAMDGHDGSSIITMYRPESLQIRVDVRFEDIPKVSLKQPVRIDNPALDEPIKVGVDEPPDFFKPEMLVDVTFLSPKQDETLNESDQELRIYIPKSLVQSSEKGAAVWLADQSAGVARSVAIETGNEVSGGLIEVVNGLDVSSRIISGDTSELSDGQRIRIVGEGSVE